jgi:Ca2+-binding EF-hand superfamily protein
MGFQERTVKRFAIAAAAAVTMGAFVAPAMAEMTNLEIIFVKADENGDLLLSKGEILRIAIEQFGIADADGDDMLEADEAGDMAADAEFSDNDSNKDGSISIEEMIEEKLADFARIDENSDGTLSLEELQAAYPQQ